MVDDLKIIRKKYGENMSKLCRELFPTLLESNGLLSSLMLSKFDDNHFLYDDLKEYDLILEFKNYICSLVNIENNNQIVLSMSPEELLDEAGYTLYECHSEEDIQSFKKYYAPGEEICTIYRGNRLDRCFVFFAVKKDVHLIKRENFKNPKRQDEYGTSVISIQFTRDNSHTLSNKNRYNHTVNNPDSTFSNNLDNIIPGLTSAFEKYYGLVQKNKQHNLEIPNYVMASDGKFYKYNYEINNVYYCIDNIIIDNFGVKKYDHEKYIIMDYFIVDLVNKKVKLYDESIRDSFIQYFDNIDKIEILKNKDYKVINFIEKNKEPIVIKLYDQNVIKEYINNNIKEIGDDFLIKNVYLEMFEANNLKKIGDFFLFKNNYLEKINLLNLEEIGNHFMNEQFGLESIFLPNTKIIGDFFMERCPIKKITADKLEIIGNNFLAFNNSITELTLPSLQKIENNFFEYNRFLEHFNAENLESFGNNFFSQNWRIDSVTFPKLQQIGDNYFNCNLSMKYRIDEIINENTNGKEK